MRTATAVTILLCFAGALVGDGALRSAAAQELPPTPREGSPEMHRLRAISAWRLYVWTLDKTVLAQAVADLVQERRKSGEDPSITSLFLMAHGHAVSGNKEAAKRTLDAARPLAPDFAGIRFLEGLAAILDGESKRAVETLSEYLERLAEAPPEPAFAAEFEFLGYMHRGSQFLQSGFHDEAVDDLERALGIVKSQGRTPPGPLVERLARAQQALKQYAKAEALLRDMLARSPGDAMRYYGLGQLFADQQRYDEAQRWYEDAVAHDPALPDPHVKLAYIASRGGDADLARMRSHLETFVELQSARAAESTGQASADADADAAAGFGAYWLIVAGKLAARGDDEAAGRAYRRSRDEIEKALRLRPNCLRAVNLRIQLAGPLGEGDEVVRPLKRRLQSLQRPEDDGPRPTRSTFC